MTETAIVARPLPSAPQTEWDAYWDALTPAPIQERSIDPFTSFEEQLAQIRRTQSAERPYRLAGVNEALGVPAILGAVSLISNTVGSLSLEAFQLGQLITDRAQIPRLIIRPNPFSTPRDFFRDTAFYLATRGEAWWWIAARDVDDSPMSLYPIPPWEITVAQNDANRLKPKITWLNRSMELWNPANQTGNVVHITYLPDTLGLRGLGPLQLAGAAVSVTVEADAWAANFFAGSLPSIIGTTEQDLSEDELKLMDEQWLEKPNNLPRWLTNGLTLSDAPYDAQKAALNDIRQHQVGESARMFSMPGALIEYQMSGQSLTYQNQADIWNDFARRCLSPHYLEPIEQTISDLLTRATVARFNLDQLLRADIKTRYDVYTAGITAGIIDAKYAQAKEGIVAGSVDFAPVPISPPAAVPNLLPINQRTRSDALRCPSCNKFLAEIATPPYRMTCPRCKTVVADLQERELISERTAVLEMLRTMREPQPAPQINVHPANITFERGALQVAAPDMSGVAGAMNELANREQPAPIVNVTTPDVQIAEGAVKVDVQPPNITVEAPPAANVTIQPPEINVAPAPPANVEVYPPPITVEAPNVTVNVPEQRPMNKSIKHDKNGKIIRIIEEPA